MPLTVSTVFNNNMPCSVQCFKQPLLGTSQPKSSFNSLKIFISDGGAFTPGFTENLNHELDHHHDRGLALKLQL